MIQRQSEIFSNAKRHREGRGARVEGKDCSPGAPQFGSIYYNLVRIGSFQKFQNPSFRGKGAVKKLIAKNRRKPEKRVEGQKYGARGTTSPTNVGLRRAQRPLLFFHRGHFSRKHLRRKTYGKFLVVRC